MKTECLLASVLLAAPVLCRAADVAPKGAPSPIPALNTSIERLMAAYEKTEDCFQTEASMVLDLAKKKSSLSAEFKGAIPNAFDDLLWQKTARINRWHVFCVQGYEELGRTFEAVGQAMRTIEPKNTNIKKQLELVNAQKMKYLQLRPAAKTSAK